MGQTGADLNPSAGPSTDSRFNRENKGGGYNEENNFWLFKENIKLILNDTIFFAFILKATG